MANVLRVSMQQTIIELLERGWSQRRIARELKVDRGSVSRYARVHAERQTEAKPAILTPGEDPTSPPKPAIVTPGSPGRQSQCTPLLSVIEGKLDQGLSAKRIHQDLVEDHDFVGEYQSVKRFVRKLADRSPLPFRRMECEPGEEVQVDFGRGAPVIQEKDRRKHPHLFRVILSHSRKGYSEVVYRQTTEAFIRALENAFRYFGGVPTTVVIDNLKAAVQKADWFDPELNPKVRSFAEHYGTVILPTKPYTPRHKGKVERGVDYAQENALRGRSFQSLAEQNRHLRKWEQTVADTRIHGTTKCQVRAAFERERPSLRPLPRDLFPCFAEGTRKVNRDGHVEVSKAYYSAPPEYRHRQVWVRWDSRLVRVYNCKFEQVVVHARVPDGTFSTIPAHIPAEKISSIERGADWMAHKAETVEPHCGAWARAMLKNRGVEGLRVLQGLLGMIGKHPARTMEAGCKKALDLEVFRLRELRRLLDVDQDQLQFSFLEKHPLIRDLSSYGAIVPFHTTNER